MYTFVIGVIIFVTVLLVLVILAQNAKGGGLTSQFGGSAASNIIGVKKTGDLLEKLTWGFIVTIIVLSVTTNFIRPERRGTSNELFEEGKKEAPAALPVPAPANESTSDSAAK